MQRKIRKPAPKLAHFNRNANATDKLTRLFIAKPFAPRSAGPKASNKTRHYGRSAVTFNFNTDR
jgi:hypothetical protein